MPTLTLDIQTHRRDEMIDITDQVRQALATLGAKDGVLTVFVPHTTAAVTINENADPDVVHDVLLALDNAVPHELGGFRHSEGNSAAHTKSSMVGVSISVPVSGGKIVLGTWQGIYFCEFDGPRRRNFVVVTPG